jgi:hypothetical protein
MTKQLSVGMATISPPQNLRDRVAETMRQSDCLQRRAWIAIVAAFLVVRRSRRTLRHLNANCFTHAVLPFARQQDWLRRVS